MSKHPFKAVLFFLIVFALGAGVGYKLVGNTQNILQVKEEKNTPKAFISEVYDKIRENYWDNISDAQLLDLFKLSIAKNGGDITVAKFEDKTKFLTAFMNVLGNMTDEQKNKFSVSVVSSVLASLSPNGRSGLYTQKQEEQLKNTVSNINPQKDLYKDLGLAKGASEEAVLQAFKVKSAELLKDKSPEAQEKLKTITYAKDTLTAKEQKEKYDQKGIEPTISSRIISPGILYVQFKKFSPTSLEEFQKAFEDQKDTPGLNSLIFDLRGNMGGAIDATPYFLGYFLGPGQYAFDFYHKGEYLPFKTQTNKLASISKYKQIVVLVDENTQSSAEMLAASLKKYHQGVIVGNRTKGWGTVERVFSLDNQISKEEKYSLFLVHSITLRDDNQPIEGRGVDPDISIKDPAWPQKLLEYFNNQSLVNTIQEVLTSK
ncbi:S41 family peptidase [Patescibacteria group bacterium]|nr:S41 family peptidase [Patescibacteria group bacterium]